VVSSVSSSAPLNYFYKVGAGAKKLRMHCIEWLGSMTVLKLAVLVSVSVALVPSSLRGRRRRDSPHLSRHQQTTIATTTATTFRESSLSSGESNDDEMESIPVPQPIKDFETAITELQLSGNLDYLVVNPFSNGMQSLGEAANIVIANMTATTEERRQGIQREDVLRGIQDRFFGLVAMLPAVLAFFAWGDVSKSLSAFVDTYGAVGRAVDGGQFTTNLLRPTIGGVVVPVISISLATLISNTITVLRERQVELRALINKEACELRLLRRAVLGMFGTRQHASRRAHALALLSGYVEQLERECNVGGCEFLEELELTGGISVNELDQLSEMLHGVDGAAASRQGSVSMAGGLLLSLNGHRSDRVAMLLSTFPGIHWGVLGGLSASILLTFLLSSNQLVLQYLNSIQLKVLFAILVGVLSSTATLCLILADPFRGSFSITEAATQLGDLRLSLKRDVIEACAEEGEISSKVVHKLLLGGSITTTSNLDSNDLVSGIKVTRGLREKLAEDAKEEIGDDEEARAPQNTGFRRRYGLASTIYFHLLTGPLGSNARVCGDMIAWMASYVSRWTRLASQRMAKFSSAIKKRKRQLGPWWQKSTPSDEALSLE